MKWLIAALQPVAVQLAGVAVQLLADRIRRELERQPVDRPADELRLPLGR